MIYILKEDVVGFSWPKKVLTMNSEVVFFWVFSPPLNQIKIKIKVKTLVLTNLI